MSTLILYPIFAIAVLAAIVLLLRKPAAKSVDESIEEASYAPSVSSGRWLDLSERIFDPSDVRWLEEELAFPKLAQSLMLDRKRLAIRWLQALQASFNELLRTPDHNFSGQPDANSVEGWRMLWLVFRFKFLVSYALLMVKLFGPYHALVPSFSWVPFTKMAGQRVQAAVLAASRSSD